MSDKLTKSKKSSITKMMRELLKEPDAIKAAVEGVVPAAIRELSREQNAIRLAVEAAVPDTVRKLLREQSAIEAVVQKVIGEQIKKKPLLASLNLGDHDSDGSHALHGQMEVAVEPIRILGEVLRRLDGIEERLTKIENRIDEISPTKKQKGTGK